MSTNIKDALAGAMRNNAALAAAINTAVGKIKPCEIGKNVNGKFVPTGTFYMFGVRIFDTLDEAKAFASKVATKRFFDAEAELAAKVAKDAEHAAAAAKAEAEQKAAQKAANKAAYAAKYNKHDKK